MDCYSCSVSSNLNGIQAIYTVDTRFIQGPDDNVVLTVGYSFVGIFQTTGIYSFL